MKNNFLNLLIMSLAIFIFSCAKENIPADVMGTEAYGKLYLIQSQETDVRNSIVVSTVSKDTTLKVYSVVLGGGGVVKKDIPITINILPQSYIDTYNADKLASMKAELLPENSYQLTTNAVIKEGSNQTGMLPIDIDINALQLNKNYVLPIRFSTDDATYEIDSLRNTAYLVFKPVASTRGLFIGNIPELANETLTANTDPRRPVLTDFFGDLIVKDRLGNLIIYPLSSNSSDTNKLGAPDTLVKAATAGSNYAFIAGSPHMFFNHYNSSITITPTANPYTTSFVRYPVTPRTATTPATIGNLAFTVGQAFYKSWYQLWSGPDSIIYGVSAGGAGRAYWVNTNKPNVFSDAAYPANQITRGVNETQYRYWTFVDDANVCNFSEGLRIWEMLHAASADRRRKSISLITTNGINFNNIYSALASIYKRDLIGVRKNGDIVMWRRFNRNLWYDGNVYDR